MKRRIRGQRLVASCIMTAVAAGGIASASPAFAATPHPQASPVMPLQGKASPRHLGDTPWDKYTGHGGDMTDKGLSRMNPGEVRTSDPNLTASIDSSSMDYGSAANVTFTLKNTGDKEIPSGWKAAIQFPIGMKISKYIKSKTKDGKEVDTPIAIWGASGFNGFSNLKIKVINDGQGLELWSPPTDPSQSWANDPIAAHQTVGQATSFQYSSDSSKIVVQPANKDVRGLQPFSPYFDPTAGNGNGMVNLGGKPMPLSQYMKQVGAKNVTLAFITADQFKEKGEPSWGGQDANLTSKKKFGDVINDVRQQGYDVTASFGGQIGPYVDQSSQYKNAADLAKAYEKIISDYALTKIDFDIEPPYDDDKVYGDVNKKNAQAVAMVQKWAKKQKRELHVTLTPAVLPSGLTEHGGQALVKDWVDAGVDIARVNIMTMDYGDNALPSHDMLAGAKQAAENTHKFLSGLYPHKTSAEIYKMIGLTPDLGVNDVQTETFSLQNAKDLVNWAEKQGIGQLGFWSVNRDQDNGSAGLDSSGVKQAPEEFSKIFAKFDGPGPVPSPVKASDLSEDVLGDFTGDGEADLVGKDKATGGLYLWQGEGDGSSFKAGRELYKSWDYTQTTAGDFDGDGKTDLVAVKDGVLYLWKGDGKGGFAKPVKLTGGWGRFTQTTAGDFDGDGKADLVALDTRTHQLKLWKGQSGTKNPFAKPIVLTPWKGFTQTTAGDFDGDGKADLIAKDPHGKLLAWKSSGDFKHNPFARPVTLTPWNGFDRMTAGDLNGDHKADLLAVDTRHNTVKTWTSTGHLTSKLFGSSHKVQLTIQP
ncbi:FG-GAP-like repeat-containing protein (plasmid) [Streptoverticillium reticulum]|uniref:FG-GAP-like repeat-containing protein n=1 Tax=Streptoverticillium reticulum TaxID=1433415 RepID=UPI0039BF42DC